MTQAALFLHTYIVHLHISIYAVYGMYVCMYVWSRYVPVSMHVEGGQRTICISFPPAPGF